MPKKNRTVYWDTCLFLALVKDEVREDQSEMLGLYAVASEIDAGQVNMVTSAVTLEELSDLQPEPRERLNTIRKKSNVDFVPFAPHMAERAGHPRDHYKRLGKPQLCRHDAYHLATAIVPNVDEFQTFDVNDKKNCRGLLPLDGNVAGFTLRIRKPQAEQPSLI